MLEFQLRSVPMFRMFADKKPAQQTAPGASVVFQLYNNLAAATSALSEAVDPDAVALGNTNTVTVTLAEYGNASLVTAKLEAVALTDVDPALANLMSYNCADSLDVVTQAALAAGNNTLVTSGATSTTITPHVDGTGAALVDNSTNQSRLSSAAIRYAVATMRSANVQPRRGMLYAGVLHPKVSVDLRQETGTAAWRDPHVYSSPDPIWTGEIGQYEGVFFCENPRVTNATTGVSSARVFNTYILGAQALAEGVGYEPQIVVGPVVDKLERFRPIGWKALIGWTIYRQEAIQRVLTSSSIQPT